MDGKVLTVMREQWVLWLSMLPIRGAHPLLFYGQDYMGTLQAYLAAGLFRLFGPSVITLRFTTILLYGIFLLALYALLCLLYTNTFAFFSLLFFIGGSEELLFRQLETAGGAPDVALFAVLVFLYTIWLIRLEKRRSSLLYALWGFLTGLAIWADPLVLPFVGMATLLLFFFCRKEIKGAALFWLFVGLLIGLAPQIYDKVMIPPSSERLTLIGPGYREPVYNIHPSTAHRPPSGAAPTTLNLPMPLARIAGSVLVSLPIATGANALCPLTPRLAWPIHLDSYTLTCTGLHGLWGAGYIFLLGIALYQSGRAFFTGWRKQPNASKERNFLLRQAGRFAFLGSIGGTIVLYTLFPQAAQTPWPSSRYLVGAFVGMTAVLFPLWKQIRRPQNIQAFCFTALLLLPLTAPAIGYVNTLQQLPAKQQQAANQHMLIETLLKMQVTRFYTDYWTCNSLIFLSTERLICTVLDNGLNLGLNRYPPYKEEVARAQTVGYVFPENSMQDQLLRTKLEQQHVPYSRVSASGFAIYRLEYGTRLTGLHRLPEYLTQLITYELPVSAGRDRIRG